MANPIAKLRPWEDLDGNEGVRLYLWCPGCEELHAVEVEFDKKKWSWNGNLDAPTINPSILMTGFQWPERFPYHNPNHNVGPWRRMVCHSYVEDGMWDFLGDCTHDFKNALVPLPPLPDWLIEEEVE